MDTSLKNKIKNYRNIIVHEQVDNSEQKEIVNTLNDIVSSSKEYNLLIEDKAYRNDFLYLVTFFYLLNLNKRKKEKKIKMVNFVPAMRDKLYDLYEKISLLE